MEAAGFYGEFEDVELVGGSGWVILYPNCGSDRLPTAGGDDSATCANLLAPELLRELRTVEHSPKAHSSGSMGCKLRYHGNAQRIRA